MSKKKISAALKGLPKNFGVAHVRAALEENEVPETGLYFVAQVAQDGPWSLLALVIDGENVIKPINTGERTIVVDLENRPPFEVLWAIGWAMSQPKTATYIKEEGTVTKLAEKRDGESGKIWAPPDPYPYQGV